MPDPYLQTCPRCGKAWPPGGFAPGNRGRHGAYCRACNREYQAAWQAANRPEPKRCSHEGCDLTIRRDSTFCAAHKPQPERTNWPASRVHVGYKAMHTRLGQFKGPASAYACADGCGRRAEEWSYDHSDPYEVSEVREYRDRGQRAVAYSLSPAHYQPRCRSCHTHKDAGRESWEVCMVPECTSKTPYPYCAKHPPRASLGTSGMPLGYRFTPVDEYGRRRARRNADLVARAFIASTMTHKRCNGCGEILPVDSFGVIKDRIERPDPFKSICLACDRKKGLAKYRSKVAKKQRLQRGDP